MTRAGSTKLASVADYLAAAPRDKRAALMKIRRAIRAAAPTATEARSYGIVGYKYAGKPLIFFGYAKGHCAIYRNTGTFVKAHAAELEKYEVSLSKGTIRFSADHPLPDRLVATIVKARIAEIEAAR